jgi:hypothetical protein
VESLSSPYGVPSSNPPCGVHVDGEWTRDGLGTDWRWTGQGVEGLEVESTRTPWTTGGLHRDSTRISGGVINTGQG